MIFRQEFLQKIKTGKVKVAFRRWRKLSVKPRGTLKTAIGVLTFKKITQVTEQQLSEKDAKAAGFVSLASLLKELNLRPEGDIYKITFALTGNDPRIKLRQKIQVNSDEKEAILAKLARLDKASREGPWTGKVLTLLKQYPGKGSKSLAEKIGMDQMKFKLNVRKLKNLGLTISLGTGYKLSPRGRVVMRWMSSGNH